MKNVWFRQHYPAKNIQTRRISEKLSRQKKLCIYTMYIDSQYCKIVNARWWIRRKYTQTASILFCVYINRHSLSPRDNATMRRDDCLMYISLAVSHMTFDHRVVFKHFQWTTRALNDTSRLLSPFFFITSRLLFSDVIPHVRFINHPSRLGKTRDFFSRHFYLRLLTFFLIERAKICCDTLREAFSRQIIVQNCINNDNKINIIQINVQDCENWLKTTFFNAFLGRWTRQRKESRYKHSRVLYSGNLSNSVTRSNTYVLQFLRLKTTHIIQCDASHM